MVFGFLKGEFIDVISWLDDTRDTMVWRFERRDNAIKYGAKLTVREGQAAVFINEGQLADVFGPGLYELQTNNMPIMTTLQPLGPRLPVALQVRDLFRQHHPLQRSEMGHAKPHHVPRPRIWPGPHPRLWHLFDARDRPGHVHERNRRHRWRIHLGRNHQPDPQHHPATDEPGSGEIRHPGAGHGRQHDGPGQAGEHRHCADDRRLWSDPAGVLHRKRLAAGQRWKRCWTSAPRWGSLAI